MDITILYRDYVWGKLLTAEKKPLRVCVCVQIYFKRIFC